MIKFWKFSPVLIVLAVCLGLMLVPAAMGVSAQPASGKVAFQMPAEVTVAKGDTFEFNVTLYNPDGANMSVATAAVRADHQNLLTINSLTQVDWPSELDQWIGTGEFTYDGGGSVGTPYLNATSVIHCTVNCTANATTGGVTTVRFVTDGGPWDDVECAVKDNSPIPVDLLDWNAVQNMTLKIGTAELTVDVSPAGTGNVTINTTITPTSYPNTTEWAWDQVVPLQAVEDVAGWTFDHWSGTDNNAVNPTTVTMDSAKSVVAYFVRYNLTVSSTSGGTVTAPGVGTFGYPEGGIVPLQATSDTGYHFVNWTGNVGTIDDVNSANTNITMNGTYSIVANFAINQYNLTINSTTCGNVTTPSEGTFGPYNHSTEVNLIATHDDNCTFDNWTGNVGTIDDVNSANTNITMNGTYSIVANFALEQYTLTINSTAGGDVTTPGEGVQGPYSHGTEVNLTATPDTNYTFVNWTGDVVWIDDWNSTTTSITMTGNYSVTANFVLKQYNLTIDSTSGGTVTAPGEGVQGPYNHSTVVNLVAEPEADYAFLEWDGNVSEIEDVNSSNTNITMYDNYSIMAIFGPHEFDVTPRSLTFTTVEGENPPSQTLDICNTGNGTLNWSVDGNKGWLGESPKGTSLDEDGCEDVKVSVDVAGMRAGDYRATITFTGSSPTQEVPVRLHIESAMEAMPVLPAGLSASALSISPQQVQPGQEVTISINVANTGGETGSYNAALYINSVVEDSQTVSVAAGASKNVIFTVSKTAAGVYDVSLAGQSGQFQVVGDGGWFGGGGLGTGGIIAIVVVVIILIVAVIFIMRGTARPE